MELIRKNEFAIIAFDFNNDNLIIHVIFLASSNLDLEIHLFQQAQIAFLKLHKVFTFIFSKYTSSANIPSKNLAAKLP